MAKEMDMTTGKGYDEWLNSLKAGDKVLVSGRNESWWMSTVARITKTQIMVGKSGMAFRKSDGVQVGSNTWSQTSLVYPSKTLVAEVHEKMKRRKAITQLHGIVVNNQLMTDIPTSDIIAAVAALVKSLPETPIEGKQ